MKQRQIIKDHTAIKYARTTNSTFNFDLQDDLYQFNPTVRHEGYDNLFRLGEEFINLKPDSPKLFYIWGHSFEDFLKLISGKSDIFYGTNKEVLL